MIETMFNMRGDKLVEPLIMKESRDHTLVQSSAINTFIINDL